MPRLIDRYVFKELAAPALLGLLAYTLILEFNQFFHLADQWAAGNMTGGEVLRSLLYSLPIVLAQTIPMSVLLGVLIGFARLSADSEITAMRTSGITYYRLLVPTLVLAVLAFGMSFGTYLKLAPASNDRYQALTSRAFSRADLNREIRPGTWTDVPLGTTLQQFNLFCRGVDTADPHESWLLDVDVLLLDMATHQGEYWRAERARLSRVALDEFTSRPRFVALGVHRVSWDTLHPDTGIKATVSASEERLGAEQRSDDAAARAHPKNLMTKTLAEVRRTLRALDEMDRIDALSKTNAQAAAAERAKFTEPWVPAGDIRDRVRREHAMEVHKKTAIPAACLVFALAGMPLGIATRRGGRPASFAVSIGVLMAWWLIFSVADTWVVNGRITPWFGAWLPNLVILLIACYLLIRLRRQQRVGVYRALTDAQLLGALVFGMLAVVLVFEHARQVQRGVNVPVLPRWVFITGGCLLAGHVLFRLFRDPIARQIARASEALQAPRDAGEGSAADVENPMTDVMDPEPSIEVRAQETAHVRVHGMLWHSRLVRLRAVLAFTLLALMSVAALQVSQHGGNLRDRVVAAATSWYGIAAVVLVVGGVVLQHFGVPLVKTVDFWVLSAFVRTLVLVLLSLVLLATVVDYVELSGYILQNRIPASVVGLYLGNRMPGVLLLMTPWATMVAALVIFGVMTRFNEVTALRVGGVSVFRLAAPVVAVALAVSGATYVLRDYVVPDSNRQAEKLLDVIKGRPPGHAQVTRGLAFALDGGGLYHFDRMVDLPPPVLPGSPPPPASARTPHLLQLVTARWGPGGTITSLAWSPDARWTGSTWVLSGGWRATIDNALEQPVVTGLDQFQTRPAPEMEQPDYFRSTHEDPDQMTFAAFARYVGEQTAAGYPTADLRVQLHQKVAEPLRAFVLVLVGLPFAFTTGRRGALYGFGVAVIVAVLYFIGVAVFGALGTAGYIPPAAAAWAPNVLFAVAGAWLLLHVRT